MNAAVVEAPAAAPPSTRPTAPRAGEPSPTSGLRLWAFCLLLGAISFIQEPGEIVADTKLDLVVDPGGFLGRATHLWDPIAAFGQVQNQAYGYFWPMGPFFAVGDLVGLPPWVIQRLWWTLLLCVAFIGVVRLCRSLGIGTPWSHVLAGFAFALSAHTVTLLGPTSVEAWPTALAPWVLLPLVAGARGGSPRRAAARSGLAVAMCGGVNAIAASAVLPLGAIWLATRSGGPRRRALFLWWVLFTALATMWWVVPLLLLGRYSPPFLDFIESAPITARPTGLADVLGGTSDWVAYLSITDWRAGHLLATTPILLIDAVALAALGLAGICRDNPHARFLLGGVMVGVLLVSFGYTGAGHGWFADTRQDWLDGVLAPLRNMHKYDVVLRLPLVLGLAHFVSTFRANAREPGDRVVRLATWVAAVAAFAGLASPAAFGKLAPERGFQGVPPYWQQAADYLGENADQGRALVVPAATFGEYWWGATHDDVFQPIATSPWAVRNVIPLAQPGNIRFLDSVTAVLEAGRPDARLAPFLAANGVGFLVVRNDLDVAGVGAPDPVVLHQALDRSPGLTKVVTFGPDLGRPAFFQADDGQRILANRGRQAVYASIEVYRVAGDIKMVAAWNASSVPVVFGDPGAGLDLPNDANVVGANVLAGDAPRTMQNNPRILTDGLLRREVFFPAVRDNQSATLSHQDPKLLTSVEPNYRLFSDQDDFETSARWVGVTDVTGSSSQADANAAGSINVAQSSAAALDGDRSTYWRSTGFGGAVGQWWQVTLMEPQELGQIRVSLGPPVGPRVTRYRVVTDAGSRVVELAKGDDSISVNLPVGVTRHIRVEAVDTAGDGGGVAFTLAEVELPDVDATRLLTLPSTGLDQAPKEIVLRRDRGTTPACALVHGAYTCDDIWVRNGEEGDTLRRSVELPTAASYDVELTGSIRIGTDTVEMVAGLVPVRVRASSSLSTDPLASGLAAIDEDAATTWTADSLDTDPSLDFSWDKLRTISKIHIEVNDEAAASEPRRVSLVTEKGRREVSLDQNGDASFAALRTARISVHFESWRETLSEEGGSVLVMPVGVSSMSFPGSGVGVDRFDPLSLPCGSGPSIVVNGTTIETQVDSSLGELMSGAPVRATSCRSMPPLTAGDNVVLALPSTAVRPDTLRLVSSGEMPPRPAAIRVEPGRWEDESRTVRVAERTEPAVLVVAENFNEGWQASLGGQRLEAIRIDGWKQGWLLPAGAAGTVKLSYEPDSSYRVALLVGLVGGLIVALFALRRGRRGGARLATAHGSAGLDVALAIGVFGLLAGWMGVAAGLVAAFAVGLSRAWSGWSLAAVAAVGLGGLVQASQRTPTNVSDSLLVQLLIVVGLGVAVGSIAANRLTFLRRSSGRSSR